MRLIENNKLLIILVLTIFCIFMLLINFSEAKVRVRGYFRRNGTYVQPHYRTYPNKYKFDNWSSWGNYNPLTGKRGYKIW